MTQNEYVVSDMISIQNGDINQIYNKIINWVKKENAKIDEYKIPSYIKIFHGNLKGNYTGMQKYIEIYLNDKSDSIEINFKIRKLSYKLKRGVYWVYWIPIIEDFYRYMGVKIDRNIMARLYNKEYFDILIKGNVRYMYLLSSLFFVSSILSIAYMPIMLLIIGVPLGILLFITYNEIRIFEKKKKRINILN